MEQNFLFFFFLFLLPSSKSTRALFGVSSDCRCVSWRFATRFATLPHKPRAWMSSSARAPSLELPATSALFSDGKSAKKILDPAHHGILRMELPTQDQAKNHEDLHREQECQRFVRQMLLNSLLSENLEDLHSQRHHERQELECQRSARLRRTETRQSALPPTASPPAAH